MIICAPFNRRPGSRAQAVEAPHRIEVEGISDVDYVRLYSCGLEIGPGGWAGPAAIYN